MTSNNKKKLIKSPGLTTDVVVFTIEENELKTLLIKRAKEPFKKDWALPGGFILNHENSQDAALRILKEKSGVKNIYLEQLYTFDQKGRDPRGRICTIAYFALVPHHEISFINGHQTRTSVFHPVSQLPPLAFDHREIVSYALKRLQAKLEYTNAVHAFLPKTFTLHQLQTAYETIFGKKLDKRNFRKKFLALRLIKPTPKISSGARQRPARLYQFSSRQPIALKRFF